jgi:hypothetical protein
MVTVEPRTTITGAVETWRVGGSGSDGLTVTARV